MAIQIAVVSVSMPAVLETCRYAEGISSRCDVVFRVHHLDGGNDLSIIERDLSGSDAVVIDLMGAEPATRSIIVSSIKGCKGPRLTFGGMAPALGRLGGFDAAKFRMDPDDETNLHRMGECWKRADSRDIDYIFDLLLGRYMGLDIEEPAFPGVREGVFVKDPVTMMEYDDPDAYRMEHGFGSKTGTVVLCYSGNSYPTSNMLGVRMLFERLEAFADVLPVAMNSYGIQYVEAMRSIIGRPDVIVNVLPFRFMAGPMGGDSHSATSLLRDLDATYVSPFFMTSRSRDEWRRDAKGLNPIEFMLDVFLPELDGGLCTIPIGSSEIEEGADGFGIARSTIVPIKDRVERVAGKVRRYIDLRRKPNSEKRIALVSYNYPPGEGNLFGGSFLDGSGSLSSILSILSDAGYDTTPATPDEILDDFLREGILNDGGWVRPGPHVIRHRDDDPHDDAIVGCWGKAPGSIMTDKGAYLIPGIVRGNVFVGIQPPRVSNREDPSSYHDQSIPPHHQYVSFYNWIGNVFCADAIVHIGTHGTLEFLPGKENAMSSECYPDSISGDIPHVYIYYSGNPSEAMIAKRRSHACLVSYMPPPFVRSGLYGDLERIEAMIAEYRESSMVDAGRAEVILESIREEAREMRVPEDPDELEDELVSIRESLIPYGLHRFGEAMDIDDAESYADNAMRFPHDGIPDPVSVFGSFEDAEEVYRDPEAHMNASEDAHAVLDYRQSLVARASHTDEAEGLLRALSGRYLDVKTGGDSMKGPEVLPTGYNIVQFDPNGIPTLAAFERGRTATEAMVAQYHESTGRWPRRAALILWGLETSRTQGMTMGQICGYLGLRQVRSTGEFVDRFEVIPLAELGRPRIDVTVSMCGFFRDMFPSLVDGIDGLFSMVSGLDEDEAMNNVKADTVVNRRFLDERGICPDDAEDLARCRLFGPVPGEYGTGMTGMVERSEWEDESELGVSFSDSLRYAYTKRFHGYDCEGLLSRNHSNVDLVSQVRDSADRELVDLDHYYEFLGGLMKAVENAGGKRPSSFVVDGSGPTVRTDSVHRSIERGVRTRVLNPKWIDGLLGVKYHGAQNINDRFSNILGLAATTGEVDSGVFSDLLSCYVADRAMRDRVRSNNNWAYMSMLERLFEANKRGYWDATDDELEMLREAFEESEDIAEGESDV